MAFLLPFLLLNIIFPSQTQFLSESAIITNAIASAISSDASLIFAAHSTSIKIYALSGTTYNHVATTSFSSTIKDVYLTDSDNSLLVGFTNHACHYHVAGNILTLQSNVTATAPIITVRMTED